MISKMGSSLILLLNNKDRFACAIVILEELIIKTNPALEKEKPACGQNFESSFSRVGKTCLEAGVLDGFVCFSQFSYKKSFQKS